MRGSRVRVTQAAPAFGSKFARYPRLSNSINGVSMHIRVRQLAPAMLGLALAATLPAIMQGFPAMAIAETHAPAVASDRDPAREANLKIFDEVFSRVRDSFYDPKFKGLNWEAVGKKYRAQAE